jgi:hypothetical protein
MLILLLALLLALSALGPTHASTLQDQAMERAWKSQRDADVLRLDQARRTSSEYSDPAVRDTDRALDNVHRASPTARPGAEAELQARLSELHRRAATAKRP